MTGEEARDEIRRITGISSEEALSIFINTNYQSLPNSVKVGNLGEPFECIVFEHCLRNQTHETLDKVPESLKKQMASDENIVKNVENMLLNNKEPDTLDEDGVEKEKKIPTFFLRTSGEEKPIGLNYGNRIVIFAIPNSVPEELYNKTINRNGITVQFGSKGEISI